VRRIPTGQRTAAEIGLLEGIPAVYPPGATTVDRGRARVGNDSGMAARRLQGAGVRGTYLHGVSIACIGLCIGLWIRAKTFDQEERANAERRALFVGLWPPMFWLIGDAVERAEAAARRRPRLRVPGR
jgi:hypothetical protein